MHTTLARVLFIIFLSLIFVIPSSFAKGKGHKKHDGPKGWEQGEKKGWESDVPPRQEKIDGKTEKNQSKQQKQNKNQKSEMGKRGKHKPSHKKNKQN
jgi:hypothetical protein